MGLSSHDTVPFRERNHLNSSKNDSDGDNLIFKGWGDNETYDKLYVPRLPS
jgi:hypothetical protein